MPPESESVAHYDNFLRSFGGTPAILVAIESADIYSAATLETVRAIHNDIQEAVDIVSIESLSSTHVSQDGELAPLTDIFDQPQALASIVAERPHLSGHLVSVDRAVTSILITPENLAGWQNRPTLADGERIVFDCEALKCESDYLTRSVDRIKAIAEKHQRGNVRTSVIGSAVINERLKSDLSRTMMRLLLATLTVVTILLTLLLRRARPILLAIWVVISSAIWSLGIMGLVGIPLSATFQLLPAFLLVIGIGYSIHLLTVVGHVPLAETVGTTGRAILAAGITTVLGLFSFGTASVVPVAQLGIVSGLGVAFVLTHTLVFLPALIERLPAASPVDSPTLRAALTPVASVVHWTANHARLTLVLTCLLLVVISLHTPSLRTSYEPLEWLPANSQIRRDIDRLNTSINGYVLEVVVTSDSRTGFAGSESLARLRRLHTALTSLETEGTRTLTTRSLIDPLNEIGGPDSIAYKTLNRQVPAWKDRFVDATGKKARLSIKIPWVPYLQISTYTEAVQEAARKITGPTTVVTGKPVLLSHAANSLVGSMIAGYGLAALLIAVVLAWWIRRPLLIAIGMVVNFVPFVIVLGVCGWLALPIDLYLLLVGTIVVSLAVDDTLHFLVGFNEGRESTVRDALSAQLAHVGPGIVTTTLVICFGFGVFVTSDFSNLATFGLVVALGSVVALWSDIAVAPALLAVCWSRLTKQPPD